MRNALPKSSTYIKMKLNIQDTSSSITYERYFLNILFLKTSNYIFEYLTF